MNNNEKEKEKLREQYRKLLEEEEKLKFKMESEVSQEKIRLRKEFIRQLELERRESTLGGVILKAQEVAELQQKQVEQEEKLAAELNIIRRKEIVDQKMRQYLRENSHELKELESQLKAAYFKKALAAQLAEKEENKLKEQIRERHARAVLEKAIGTLEEQEEDLRLKEKKEKEKLKQSLQDQIILKERMRQEEFMAFMKEKKMFDDILQAIKDEEIRELERKKIMQEKLREEMHMFQKAKEMWKAKERLKIQEEESKRKEINEKKERAKHKEEANKKVLKGSFDKMVQEMSRKMIEKQAKLAEKDEIVATLMWNEKEEEEKRKAEFEKEKEKLRKEEARTSFKILLAEKARKEKEEKALDIRFASLMKAKTDEEERKEMEKQEQRKEVLINNRKYNEEAMKRNIQKRAEELKLTQFINELQEKEENKKAAMIEEERIRILKSHAHKLLGYFPKGCLKEKDLEILGLTGNLPCTES